MMTARRPRSNARSTIIFTTVLLPAPIEPATMTLGLDTTPVAYASKGSRTKAPPRCALPSLRPASPVPASWKGTMRRTRSRDVAQCVQERLTIQEHQGVARSTTMPGARSRVRSEDPIQRRCASPPSRLVEVAGVTPLELPRILRRAATRRLRRPAIRAGGAARGCGWTAPCAESRPTARSHRHCLHGELLERRVDWRVLLPPHRRVSPRPTTETKIEVD